MPSHASLSYTVSSRDFWSPHRDVGRIKGAVRKRQALGGTSEGSSGEGRKRVAQQRPSTRSTPGVKMPQKQQRERRKEQHFNYPDVPGTIC